MCLMKLICCIGKILFSSLSKIQQNTFINVYVSVTQTKVTVNILPLFEYCTYCGDAKFNLSNQPHMHWNLNTTVTQSPTCLGSS